VYPVPYLIRGTGTHLNGLHQGLHLLLVQNGGYGSLDDAHRNHMDLSNARGVDCGVHAAVCLSMGYKSSPVVKFHQ